MIWMVTNGYTYMCHHIRQVVFCITMSHVNHDSYVRAILAWLYVMDIPACVEIVDILIGGGGGEGAHSTIYYYTSDGNTLF